MNDDKLMVLNLLTGECELGFTTREQAKDFIKTTGIPEISDNDLDDNFEIVEANRTLIIPYCFSNTGEQAELTIYGNTDKGSKFSSVAEYGEDTLNSDFISTQSISVKVQLA